MATNSVAAGGVGSSRTFSAIFGAGLSAGILDITAAFVTWFVLRRISPVRILQGIASGLLGRAAFKGGLGTAALGLVLHFVIAFGAAVVYYVANRQIDFLREQTVLGGVLYGVAVYVFMYWIVMPLSAFQRGPFSLPLTILAIVTHMVCVGLPIALAVRRFGR